MMELLSPAGSIQSLVAAVQNGADAVYFGGAMFNARRFADNFAGNALSEALDYCHERGVRCYITLNTLIFDRELSAALDFAGELYRLGADAVLVQDLGLASILRAKLPELTLHASTQMGIHDAGGLAYCSSIGIKRAVLAREVSLADIVRMKSKSDVELEVFAHGALCMSFSGSCLYSSMAGERSGNRGTCAQPCRKNASVLGLPGEGDFCLSPNDICMIEHLDELERAGVCCIKLEGRMKKPEYVAAVTRCYRAALDGADADAIGEMKSELFRLFNRGEFSTSHYFTDSVRTNAVASSRPEKADYARANESVSEERPRRRLDMRLELKIGSEALIELSTDEHKVSACGAVVVAANKPQHASAYSDRLKKLGGTPFFPGEVEVAMSGDCYISAADLNALRRSAVAALLQEYHVRRELGSKLALPVPPPVSPLEGTERLVYAVVSTPKQARIAFENGADAVAIEPTGFELDELALLDGISGSGKRLLLALPNALLTGVQRDFVRSLLLSGRFDGAEANNIGQTELLAEAKMKKRAPFLCIAGIGLNALNCRTVLELLRVGFDYVIPSVELSNAQLRDVAARCGGRLIQYLHGRVPVMQLAHCPLKEASGCRGCRLHAGSVVDGDGRVFPLETLRFKDKCLVRMLNCVPTDLVDLTVKLPPAAGYRLSFIGEESGTIGERLLALRASLAGSDIPCYPHSTRGHLNRTVD